MSGWHWIAALALLAYFWSPAQAQAPKSRFGIADNSFLVEEAFNQEAGIFQNIFLIRRAHGGGWEGAFTQEWPIRTQAHQFSFTVPFSGAQGTSRMGDVLLNYRWQVSLDTGSRPAFAPRISVILPSSAERRALGASGTGLEVNLPVSKELGAVIVHANAGVTWFSESSSPFLAGRVIWGLRPLFHPMLEVTASWSDVDGDAKEATLTVLPGFRAGWNVGEQQVVLGMGIPIERGAARDYGLLVYFSYELPFRKN